MPELSVVIPSFNEAANLPALVSEIESALSSWCGEFEIIIVSDGSTDDTAAVIAALANPRVTLLDHSGRRGKTAAWQTGVDAAKHEIVCTLDGDMQDDPADIKRFYEELSRGSDLVTGRRTGRKFSALRNLASYCGNGLLRYLTGTALRDQGCGIKLFRKETLRRCKLEHEMHRFFPLIAELSGFKVTECEVRNRSRHSGKSKYTWMRILPFAAGIWRLRRYLPADSRTAEYERSRIFELTVIACTILGLILRAALLDKDGIWYDEFLSYTFSRIPLSEIPGALARQSVHPPLYFLLLHLWSGIFGFTESGMRSLSVLFGVLAIPAIAVLARRLFNRTVGCAAALALALSPFHLFQSQNARPYALMSLLLTLSFLAYLRLIERGSPRRFASYILWTVLLSYTHAYALCALPAQGLHFLWWRLKRETPLSIPAFAAAQLAVAAGFSPWLPSFIYQAAHPAQWKWITKIDWDTMPTLFTTLAYGDTWLRNGFYGLALLALVSAIHSADRNFRSSIGAILLWGALPVICGVGISLLYTPTFDPRYMMQTFLMLQILIGVGVYRAGRSLDLRLLGCALVAALSLAPIRRYFLYPQRTQWREATEYIEARARDSDGVYVEYSRPPISYYSRRRLNLLSDLEMFPDCSSNNPTPFCQDGARVWIVFYSWPGHTADDALQKVRTNGFEPAGEAADLTELRVELFVRKTAKPSL